MPSSPRTRATTLLAGILLPILPRKSILHRPPPPPAPGIFSTARQAPSLPIALPRPTRPVWSAPALLPCPPSRPHYSPTTWAIFLFPKHSEMLPTSRSVHVPFPLPGRLFRTDPLQAAPWGPQVSTKLASPPDTRGGTSALHALVPRPRPVITWCL